VQTRAVFHLWPRLHQDLLRFLDLVPEDGLEARPPGAEADLASTFRHLAAVEEYWRRAVLEPEAAYAEIPPEACPDRAALRARLAAAFAATERLLDGSLVEALAERPVKTRYPVRNALEALTLCHLHTVHHRAQVACALRALGVEPGDWL
jgi:uncharacterized damage-inducible protein DinB